MQNILSTDIYDIVKSVKDIQERFIDEEDPETLAAGIFGYLSSIHSTLIQNSTITTGEMGNELFPARAKFERNVINHAIVQNISDINAIPAKINAILGIFEEDLDTYMISDKFTIDKEMKFAINNYEYHLEYDIIIRRSILANNEVTYSAMYNIERKNKLSDIRNPYLIAPFKQRYNGKWMIFFYIKLSQEYHDIFSNTLITNNLVETKTFIFHFDNQLATFMVKVTEGDTVTYLEPVFEGLGVDQNIIKFCYYSYIDASHIRVRFDSISYVPKINAKIEVEIITTDGAYANFKYNKTVFPILTSTRFNYDNVMTTLQFTSNSKGGLNRKSVDELRKILPKEALSRGSVTCWQDLQNYFNMLNTDQNRLIVQKRVDNQFERSYFAFLLLKDSYSNVVPTNTFDIIVREQDFDTHDNRKYVLKPGCYIKYNNIDDNNASIYKYDDTNKEKLDYWQENDKENFIYTCPFMLVVTGDPLYVSYYLTLVDNMAQMDFSYVNMNSPVQFICTNIHWYRQFLTEPNTYYGDFEISPSTDDSIDMIFVDENNKVKKNLIKAFLVFYNDTQKDVPYAYVEADYLNSNSESQSRIYKFQTKLYTKDVLNDDNKIYIQGLTRAGESSPTETMVLTPHVGARLYICVNINDEYGELGRYNLDVIVPELDGYTVCNMYTVDLGLKFYENYSEVISSQVKDTIVKGTYDNYNAFYIKRVPCIRRSYVMLEENMKEFVVNVSDRKAYIDNALYVLEDNFLIDFKFFNTYGPSRTYTKDRYGTEGKLIQRVNLTLDFELKLLQNSDKNTKGYILRDIKDLIEDLNDISSLHIPNLITTITNKYRESIEYIEFLGFNNNGPGVQHIYRQDFNVLTGLQDVNMIPEFLTVHTDLDMTPDINIILAR